MQAALPNRGRPRLPRDLLFWAGVGVWGVSLLPSLVPVLPPDLTFDWSDQYSDVPILIFILIGTVLAIHRASSQRERVFWRLLTGSIVGWLAVRGLYLLIPYETWGTGTDLVSDIFYLGGYLCVALAVERGPLRSSGTGGGAQLQSVEAAGTLLFAFGLLTYFVLVPSVFNPEIYASWVSSLLLFAVLDAYLVVRGLMLLRGGVDAGWKAPMRWLTVVFALWLVGDLTEGFMYMEAIPFAEPGTPWDVIWHLPSLALLAAVRSRAWYEFTGAGTGPGAAEVMGQLSTGGEPRGAYP